MMEQTLYVGDATFSSPGPATVSVMALDGQSGTKRWQTTIAQGGANAGQSIQCVEATIYVCHAAPGSTSASIITALVAQDGSILWSYQVEIARGAQIVQAFVHKNVIYLHILYSTGGTIDAAVEARSVANRELLWRYTPAEGMALAQCIFAEEMIYLVLFSVQGADTRFTLAGLHSCDGTECWHEGLDGEVFKVVATKQAMYVVSACSGSSLPKTMEITALTYEGKLLWRQSLSDISNVQDLVVLNNILYLNSPGSLMALRIYDGALLWTRQEFYQPGVQTNDTLFYALHNFEEFCALDMQSGEHVWCTRTVEAGSFTVASKNMVYTAASFRGGVQALQKSDGHVVWHYEEIPGRRIFGLVLNESL